MKTHKLLSILLVTTIVLSGCGKKSDEKKGSVSDTKSEDAVTEISSSSEESTAASETASETTEPTETTEPEPKYENIHTNVDGHHTFEPHIFSKWYLEQFGEATRDSFFNFVDAAMAGEDSFECCDEEAYGWILGRLMNWFFPVGRDFICNAYEGEKTSWKNGQGVIEYKIPKEEFVKKAQDFKNQIVAILDDCVSDDYNDFEKALALYEYMTTTYTYDYDMYEVCLEKMDEQSPYRLLTQKTGICNEIAGLYNYLLLQLGVDSDEIAGSMHNPDGTAEGHSWVYVTLDGVSYHVDPTWGLTETSDCISLGYFLFTDDVREQRDSFPREEYSLAAYGDQTRKYFTFEASDDRYKELWDGYYQGMDRESHEVIYLSFHGDEMRFPYAA